MVFGAASAALIAATVVGVIVGSFLSAYIDEKVLSYIAGCGFIIIRAYTLHTA
jgi:putative Ca2+/H+ antiporter (TMEM165/GDT1 family)